jgi:hypothetical protein
MQHQYERSRTIRPVVRRYIEQTITFAIKIKWVEASRQRFSMWRYRPCQKVSMPEYGAVIYLFCLVCHIPFLNLSLNSLRLFPHTDAVSVLR